MLWHRLLRRRLLSCIATRNTAHSVEAPSPSTSRGSTPQRRTWLLVMGFGLIVAAIHVMRADACWAEAADSKPRAASAAKEICEPSTEPCLIAEPYRVAPPGVLDFADRDVVITRDGALLGSVSIRCKNFETEERNEGPAIDGGLALNVAGAIAIFASGDIDLRGPLRTRGNPGGEIHLMAGGDLVVQAELDVSEKPAGADGGSVTLESRRGSIWADGRIALTVDTDEQYGGKSGGYLFADAAQNLRLGGEIVIGDAGTGRAVDVRAGGHVDLSGLQTAFAEKDDADHEETSMDAEDVEDADPQITASGPECTGVPVWKSRISPSGQDKLPTLSAEPDTMVKPQGTVRSAGFCGRLADGSHQPCRCGDIIRSNTVLKESDPIATQRCPERGLTVRAEPPAESITLDLNGVVLRGSGLASGLHIERGGSDGAVIVDTSPGGRSRIVGFRDGVTATTPNAVKRIEGLTIEECHRDGIRLRQRGAILRRVTTNRNGRDGLVLLGSGGRIIDATSRENTGSGLTALASDTIVSGAAQDNQEFGLVGADSVHAQALKTATNQKGDTLTLKEAEVDAIRMSGTCKKAEPKPQAPNGTIQSVPAEVSVIKASTPWPS